MDARIVVPDSVRGGFYWKWRGWAFALWGHTLQCDQRWVFLIRRGMRSFGYRTRGDAGPDLSTYYNAGWYWPWHPRGNGGRR